MNGQLSESRVRLVSLNQEIKYLEQKAQQENNLIAQSSSGSAPRLRSHWPNCLLK